MLRAGTRRSLIYAPSAAAGWWVVAGKTCVAAYQPRGAASYAASLVNLASPGTHNAYEGTAPDWDATNGWKFLEASSTYLETGIYITNTQSRSALIRFSNRSTYGFLFGTLTITASPFYGFGIQGNNGSTRRVYLNSGSGVRGFPSAVSSGILAIAGDKGYLDGVYDLDIPNDGNFVGDRLMPIGCRRLNTSLQVYQTCYLQAFAFYSDVLTADEIATVSAAMAAL